MTGIMKALMRLDLWWTERRERKWVHSEVVHRIGLLAHCTEPEREEELFEEFLYWVGLNDSLDDEFDAARRNLGL